MATKIINLNNLATFLAKLKTLFVAKELADVPLSLVYRSSIPFVLAFFLCLNTIIYDLLFCDSYMLTCLFFNHSSFF